MGNFRFGRRTLTATQFEIFMYYGLLENQKSKTQSKWRRAASVLL
jgi:hypothetical protein